MALYRTISINFWTDLKVDDEFTPEDKYFFLYLLTNPHTNLCGCYEVSTKQIGRETGYNEDTIKRLLKRMETIHNVIRYDYSTKEVLIINWSKYNWSSSEKVEKAVLKVASHIKSDAFREMIMGLSAKKITNSDIQSTEYRVQSTVTETVTESVTESDSDSDTDVSIGYAYPIDTLSEKPQKVKTSVLDNMITDYTENAELIDALKDYVKFRKALAKGVFTERALQLSLNKLDKYGEDDLQKIAIVNQSIERGWKGIFPLKEGSEQKKNEESDFSKYEQFINVF